VRGPFRPDIDREEINQLPLGRYTGDIRIVHSDAEAVRAVEELSAERVLGFDTETRAAFRKGECYPTSLVQLAGERAVYIFQLAGLARLGGLGAIFESPKIFKAGVSLGYDLKKLKELKHFQEAGMVELETLADRAGIRSNGLRPLSAIVMGVRISKGAKCSDWSRPRLSPDQIAYAATDAWACREICVRLEKHLGSPPLTLFAPPPPQPPKPKRVFRDGRWRRPDQPVPPVPPVPPVAEESRQPVE
jgi:ribonuclease D